ncbi:hypothetical protein ACU4GD_29970 [Cupriavidus basilensis]
MEVIGHDEDNALPGSGSRPQARFHPHITLARCAPAVAHTTLQAWRGSQSGLVCEPFPRRSLHPVSRSHLASRWRAAWPAAGASTRSGEDPPAS